MNGKELRPKSFRIDDKTAEKFKEISGAIGGNQQETLSKLIEAYEFQSGKAILTERKAEIEQFEKYITAVTRMFMGSLEDNQNMADTVRTEFDALLKSKDATIQDLQEKIRQAVLVKEEALNRAEEYAGENVRLADMVKRLENEYTQKVSSLDAMLSDKDNLNRALTDSCNGLKQKVEEMRKSAEEAAKAQEKLGHLNKEYDKVKRQMQEEKESHERVRKQLEDQWQLALDRAVLEVERERDRQIEQLKAERQQEVDRYQKKYLELLEKID